MVLHVVDVDRHPALAVYESLLTRNKYIINKSHLELVFS